MEQKTRISYMCSKCTNLPLRESQHPCCNKLWHSEFQIYCPHNALALWVFPCNNLQWGLWCWPCSSQVPSAVPGIGRQCVIVCSWLKWIYRRLTLYCLFRMMVIGNPFSFAWKKSTKMSRASYSLSKNHICFCGEMTENEVQMLLHWQAFVDFIIELELVSLAMHSVVEICVWKAPPGTMPSCCRMVLCTLV